MTNMPKHAKRLFREVLLVPSLCLILNSCFLIEPGSNVGKCTPVTTNKLVFEFNLEGGTSVLHAEGDKDGTFTISILSVTIVKDGKPNTIAPEYPINSVGDTYEVDGISITKVSPNYFRIKAEPTDEVKIIRFMLREGNCALEDLYVIQK